MSRKKPAPAVASTGCSGLMFWRSLHPRGPPPAPRRDDDDAEQYRKRVQYLEEEIRRLSKRLGQEERPAPPAAECVKTKEEGGGAATTTATKKLINTGHGDGGVEMERLEDGSYLHEVRRFGGPWERLAVQVPQPVVAKDAASASEALDKMTVMKPEDLYKHLTRKMLLKDIAGQRNAGEPVRRTAQMSSGDDSSLPDVKNKKANKRVSFASPIATYREPPKQTIPDISSSLFEVHQTTVDISKGWAMLSTANQMVQNNGHTEGLTNDSEEAVQGGDDINGNTTPDAPPHQSPEHFDRPLTKGKMDAIKMLVEQGQHQDQGQEERPAPPAAECVKTKAREDGGAATTAATKKSISAGHGDGGVKEMERLEDGSYLHEVRRFGRPWERLAVQVLLPLVIKDAASASEALDKLTAKRPEDLYELLTRKMPLKDIADRWNAGEPVRRTVRMSSGDDLMEALLFEAMDKMEGLVLEGLKIRMAATAAEHATAAAAAADQRRDQAECKDCMVHVVPMQVVNVVLMQVRDPNESYGAIGDPMIGLIESRLEMKNGKVKLEMLGMHVAGTSFMNRKQANDGRCMMWSASLRQCKGPCNGLGGDGCRCSFVRNPDRVFRR